MSVNNDSQSLVVIESEHQAPGDFSSLRMTLEGKKLIVKQYFKEGLPIRSFCANHKIPPATLSRWKKQYLQSTKGGADTLYAKAGRPTKIDEEGQEAIIISLKNHLQGNKHVRKRDLRAICEDAVLQTAKRRNIEMNFVELSAKTVKKYVVAAKQLLADALPDDGEHTTTTRESPSRGEVSEDAGQTSTDETGDSHSTCRSTDASIDS